MHMHQYCHYMSIFRVIYEGGHVTCVPEVCLMCVKQPCGRVVQKKSFAKYLCMQKQTKSNGYFACKTFFSLTKKHCFRAATHCSRHRPSYDNLVQIPVDALSGCVSRILMTIYPSQGLCAIYLHEASFRSACCTGCFVAVMLCVWRMVADRHAHVLQG